MRSCEIMTENYPFGYGHNGCVVTHIFRHMIYRYGDMKTIFVRDIFDARRWSYSVL